MSFSSTRSGYPSANHAMQILTQDGASCMHSLLQHILAHHGHLLLPLSPTCHPAQRACRPTAETKSLKHTCHSCLLQIWFLLAWLKLMPPQASAAGKVISAMSWPQVHASWYLCAVVEAAHVIAKHGSGQVLSPFLLRSRTSLSLLARN